MRTVHVLLVIVGLLAACGGAPQPDLATAPVTGAAADTTGPQPSVEANDEDDDGLRSAWALLEELGVTVADGSVTEDVPPPSCEMARHAIFDHFGVSPGYPTARDAVAVSAGHEWGELATGGRLVLTSDGGSSQTWTLVDAGGRAIGTVRVDEVPKGGWLAGSSTSCG